LTALLGEIWVAALGQELSIKTLAVDSGFNTQVVYSWCRQYPITRVMAVKGHESSSVLVGQPSTVDVTSHGRRVRRGLKVYPVGVNLIKAELYGWLRLDSPDQGEPEPHGFCHFPQYDEEFFKQLTAEEFTVKLVKGFKRHEWHKTRDRNEALDCRVYARAAASIVGMDRFKADHWARLEIEAGLNSEKEESKVKQVLIENAPVIKQKFKIKRRLVE